jgi:hypothetical protein
LLLFGKVRRDFNPMCKHISFFVKVPTILQVNVCNNSKAALKAFSLVYSSIAIEGTVVRPAFCFVTPNAFA